MLVRQQQVAGPQLRIDEGGQLLRVGAPKVQNARLLVNNLRQLVRAGRNQKLAELNVEIRERNDGKHPVHRGADRAPALVVAVRGTSLIARSANVGHERGKMGRLAQQTFDSIDHARVFGHRRHPRLSQLVAADRVLRRLWVFQRGRVGVGLRLLPNDTTPGLDFVRGK